MWLGVARHSPLFIGMHAPVEYERIHNSQPAAWPPSIPTPQNCGYIKGGSGPNRPKKRGISEEEVGESCWGDRNVHDRDRNVHVPVRGRTPLPHPIILTWAILDTESKKTSGSPMVQGRSPKVSGGGHGDRVLTRSGSGQTPYRKPTCDPTSTARRLRATRATVIVPDLFVPDRCVTSG